jgi:peptidoglycan hydrolase-like protein with peptidoglycan-binding domain
VRRVQKLIGVSPADGIVGPKTRKATRALGVILPLRSLTPTKQPAARGPGEYV